MARDLETARNIVQCVMRPVMATSLGGVLIAPSELLEALNEAAQDVADLLDPDEDYDVEITDEEIVAAEDASPGSLRNPWVCIHCNEPSGEGHLLGCPYA